MSNLFIGSIVSVKVTGVTTYGIIVDYHGQKGFIQISELSWDHHDLQNRVSNMYKVGDVIQVKILSQTDQQFYASVRAVNPELNPWNENNRLIIGQELTGRVVAVAEYGYLIKLPNFVIAVLPIEAVGDDLKEDQMIGVKVASVDVEKQKVLLERQ